MPNETTLHLAGISGSLRKDSYNTRILRQIPELLPPDVDFTILSPALPLYNGDLDLPIAGSRPDEVRAFRDALAKADGLVIVSPEYNWSIPGVLKNAIDWASRGEDSPILGKPVALMGATPGAWGTVRMQLAFAPVFQALNMQMVLKPQLLIAKAKEKFDGVRFSDEAGLKLIRSQLDELIRLIRMRKA